LAQVWMQIKRKGNSFPPFHIIMRSLLVLDFMLARAANVWVDDDLSLLQTRAVLQNDRNLLFSDSMDNVITEDDPVALLHLISGQCVTDGLCVSSPNFPNNYGDNERCELSVTSGNYAPFAVEAFNTESSWDVLIIDGVGYSGDSEDPDSRARLVAGVVPTNSISWQPDESTTKSGFRICLQTMTTTTTTTTTDPFALLHLISGQCVTDGLCVSSPNFPNNYGDNERCELSVTSGNSAPFAIESFNTENGFDFLIIDGVRHSGDSSGNRAANTVPFDVVPTNSISWQSDGSSTKPGFRICLQTTTTTTTMANEASAVGDPHIVTSSGRMYDLALADRHRH